MNIFNYNIITLEKPVKLTVEDDIPNYTLYDEERYMIVSRTLDFYKPDSASKAIPVIFSGK